MCSSLVLAFRFGGLAVKTARFLGKVLRKWLFLLSRTPVSVKVKVMSNGGFIVDSSWLLGACISLPMYSMKCEATWVLASSDVATSYCGIHVSVGGTSKSLE